MSFIAQFKLKKSGIKKVSPPLIMLTFFCLYIKTYSEKLYLATMSLLGLGVFFLALGVYQSKDVKKEAKVTMTVSLILLAVHLALSALSEINVLGNLPVLALGLLFFLSLLWLYFTVSEVKVAAKGRLPLRLWGLGIFTLFIIFSQILLGSAVVAWDAGLACVDFPLCQGEFIPELKGPIGLQVSHRLMAYLVAITIFSLYLVASQSREEAWMDKRCFNICGFLTAGVLVQIGIGAANVVYRVPLALSLTHIAMSLLLLGLSLRLLYIFHIQSK